MMKRLALTTAFALAAGIFVHAQQTTQQTPPSAQTPPAQAAPEEKSKGDAKTDAKTAVTVAGKWNISVETQSGEMASVLDLKLDGKKITGTISSQMGEAPIEGEFADGKLTFGMQFQGANGSMQLAFSATLKDDKLTGTMDVAGQGLNIPWKGERVKDK